MRRTAPGVVLPLVALGLVTLSSCSRDAGTSTAIAAPASKPTGAASVRKSALAASAVLPREYFADRRAPAAGFDVSTFVNSWSADPAVDRALLLNAGFKDGYRDTRLTKDGKKRFTLQLFQAASPARAERLKQGFWGETGEPKPFELKGVPGVLTDSRVEYEGGSGRYVATAESIFTVGPLVAELRVRQTSADNNLRPDTRLITSVSQEQYTRLAKRPSIPN